MFRNRPPQTHLRDGTGIFKVFSRHFRGLFKAFSRHLKGFRKDFETPFKGLKSPLKDAVFWAQLQLLCLSFTLSLPGMGMWILFYIEFDDSNVDWQRRFSIWIPTSTNGLPNTLHVKLWIVYDPATGSFLLRSGISVQIAEHGHSLFDEIEMA